MIAGKGFDGYTNQGRIKMSGAAARTGRYK